jgi:hypothetical protein
MSPEPSASVDARDLLKSRVFEEARLGARVRWLLLRRVTDKGRLLPGIRTAELARKREILKTTVRPRPATARRVAACRWLPAGPRNINGRIRCLAVDPRDGQIVYAGAADGGVWKTTDGGQRWRPLMHDQESLSIGALALDPSVPDTVYAGTGEPLIIGGLQPYLWSYEGTGVYRSDDGGLTWDLTPPQPNEFVYRIAVNPFDSSEVLCAGYASAGTGGLAHYDTVSKTWTLVQPGIFTDVVFDPVNTGVAYAAERDGIVWKRTAAGAPWVNRSSGLPAAAKRVSLAIGTSDPAVLYARVESTGAVYRTSTAAETPGGGGAAWALVGTPAIDLAPQRWWCSHVAVDPTDTDVVYAGGNELARSADAGATWDAISLYYGPTAEAPPTHADHHQLAFDPADSRRFYVATDGGVFHGAWTGGTPRVTWAKVSTGLQVTQFYDLGMSAASRTVFGGGCQDNGTLVTTGGGSWRHIYGGDGSYVAFHPTDPWTVWAARWDPLPILERSTDGGTVFDRADQGIVGSGSFPVSVFTMDPANPARLFFGTTRLNRTVNGDALSPAAVVWQSASVTIGSVTEITVASSQVIYAGTMLGTLHCATDGGATATSFQPITPAVAGWPQRWLSGITIRPGAPSTMFVTFHGSNDVPGPGGIVVANGVWKGVHDPATSTWPTPMAPCSTGLPNLPIASLVVDPDTPTTLYVATDIGVYRSTDDGGEWLPFDEGLPNAPVIDLAVDPVRKLLRAATHGRGMYQRSLAAECPPVMVFVRDNILDTGDVVPSPSGDPDPTVQGGTVYHWQSADIKVDTPPLKALDAVVDGVEFDNPVHRLMPLPTFGFRIESVLGLSHENPIRGVVNRVSVQVHNGGWQHATAVTVRLLWADAGAGLPPLPADFWANFATDTWTQTQWHLIDTQVIPVVGAGTPEVVQFAWTPPASVSNHACLLVIVHSDDDPWPLPNQLDVDALVRDERRVALKNVHPVTVFFWQGRRIAWPVFRWWNAQAADGVFDFRLASPRRDGWDLLLALPRLELARDVDASLDGFRRIPLDPEQWQRWIAAAHREGALGERAAAALVEFDAPLVLELRPSARSGMLRGVRLPAGGHVPAVLIAVGTAGTPAPRPARVDAVLQREGAIVGGSTFVIGASSEP